MNMLLCRSLRLIAAAVLSIIAPTSAFASDVEQAKSFQLAMGPMSAAQKNQGSTTIETAPIKPLHHVRHRHVRRLR
jgi:hypothetical protein